MLPVILFKVQISRLLSKLALNIQVAFKNLSSYERFKLNCTCNEKWGKDYKSSLLRIHIAIHVFYASIIRCKSLLKKALCIFQWAPLSIKLTMAEFAISIHLPSLSFIQCLLSTKSDPGIVLGSRAREMNNVWASAVTSASPPRNVWDCWLQFCLPAWALRVDNPLSTTPHPSAIWLLIWLYPWALLCRSASLLPHFASCKPVSVTLHLLLSSGILSSCNAQFSQWKLGLRMTDKIEDSHYIWISNKQWIF